MTAHVLRRVNVAAEESPAGKPYARIALIAVITAFLIAACWPEGRARNLPGAAARNLTDTTLHFVVDGQGGQRFDGGTLEPGMQDDVISGGAFSTRNLLAPTGCTVGDLIALDPSGREIARHGPGVCSGDLWIVTAPGTTPPASLPFIPHQAHAIQFRQAAFYCPLDSTQKAYPFEFQAVFREPPDTATVDLVVTRVGSGTNPALLTVRAPVEDPTGLVLDFSDPDLVPYCVPPMGPGVYVLSIVRPSDRKVLATGQFAMT